MVKGFDLRVLVLVVMVIGFFGTWFNRNWFRFSYFMYFIIIYRGFFRVYILSTRTMFGFFSWDIILIFLLKLVLKNNFK